MPTSGHREADFVEVVARVPTDQALVETLLRHDAQLSLLAQMPGVRAAAEVSSGVSQRS